MKKKYESFEEGYRDIKNGNLWCLIQIDKNFTQDLYKTYENFGKRKELKFKNLIHLHFDNTNQQISYSIRDEFIHSVKAVSESYLKVLEMIGENNDSYPIKFEMPVYGQAEPVFTYFMAPGIALRFFFN